MNREFSPAWNRCITHLTHAKSCFILYVLFKVSHFVSFSIISLHRLIIIIIVLYNVYVENEFCYLSWFCDFNHNEYVFALYILFCNARFLRWTTSVGSVFWMKHNQIVLVDISAILLCFKFIVNFSNSIK